MDNLKPLVNNKDLWTAYQEDILEEIENSRKALEQATLQEDMFRLQGEVRALRKRLKLRDRVNHSHAG